MSVSRQLILLVLIAFVVAGGGYSRQSRLTLQRSRRNVFNFACGAYGSDGNPTYYGQQAISYTFGDLPRWLSASGSSLYGTPPSDETGPWYVSVNYRGGDRNPSVFGSSRYELSYGDSGEYRSVSGSRRGSGSIDSVVYGSGYLDGRRNVIDASEYSYVVLVPILTTNTRTVYEKQPDTVVQQEPVSCTSYESAYSSATSELSTAQANVNTINTNLAEAIALVERLRGQLAAAQQSVSSAQSVVEQANAELSSCRSRQAAAEVPIVVPGKIIPRTETYTTTKYVAKVVGGYSSDSCGSIVVDDRGTGSISSVGSDGIVVAGLGELNFGACTLRSYRKGWNHFAVSDRVSYETYQWGGKRWARRVICQ